MQLKGMVKFFTAALILFSLWRLSFTFIAHNVDVKNKARAEKMVSTSSPETKGSDRDYLVEKAIQHINDSLRDETVYNFIGAKYTYKEVKEKELQLGLDLQGGMSVTLEVGLDGLVTSMSNSPKDPNLLRAIAEADKMKANSNADFVNLFGEAYQKVVPGGRLAPLFVKANQPAITQTSTNEQVLAAIRTEAKEAVKRTYNVLTKRIDKFGVTQPTINLDENKGIIIVELAGVKDPESVRKVLQATAKLQFWEVATINEVGQQLVKANDVLKNYLKGDKAEVKDTAATVASNDTAKKSDTAKAVAATAATDTGSLISLLGKEDTSTGASKTAAIGDKRDADLFSIMQPAIDQQGRALGASYIGIVARKDAEKLKEYFALDIVKNQFPSNIKFLLGDLPGKKAGKEPPFAVYAIRTTDNGSDNAKLEGDHVKTAKFDYQNGRAEISLEMDQQGTVLWAQLTGANVGKPIAITLDDYVYSAPNVNEKISGGRSSITGDFTAAEGTDLANILQTGKLDAPAKIVQEQVVGPTLGQESIDGGITSFGVAFLVIFILMIVYYSTGGIVANIALILNMLFTFGILANMGATLTMAGIAGIVLGIGMAVDTNVLIFERIKEELALGDTYADAVAKGYKRSYAPVLDGHITSFITAVILFIFGLGPIRGFATTQMLAIALSLFTGILVSRLITDSYMKRGRHFNYFTKLSKAIFQKAHFKFIQKRKIAYVFSSILILAGIASFFNGFNYGVEFDGGRSYTIKFDQVQKEGQVREKLHKYLGKYPVVKKIGVSDQLNITTDYLITDPSRDAEQKVIAKIHEGLQKENMIGANVDVATFSNKYIQSGQTVLPTISKDLKQGAVYATLVAILAIFIYIFIRFRKWQYSLGTIVAIIHDVAVTLAVFSFFKDIVPFSLEIDQHFIAALLTVIGFSMNDTVIVFDRIREYFRKTPNGNKVDVVNRAINDTLSRTIMTSLTVFLTAIILFIFGGEVLRGFAFAMSIGVLAGTYSSIFVAAPILVDMDKGDSLRVEEDKEERIKQLKEQA
ncbi:MAG: protein translocase subunit SecDF [Taibaiella sp.]|jgi:SecD/SecF fusion protein